VRETLFQLQSEQREDKDHLARFAQFLSLWISNFVPSTELIRSSSNPFAARLYFRILEKILLAYAPLALAEEETQPKVLQGLYAALKIPLNELSEFTTTTNAGYTGAWVHPSYAEDTFLEHPFILHCINKVGRDLAAERWTPKQAEEEMEALYARIVTSFKLISQREDVGYTMLEAAPAASTTARTKLTLKMPTRRLQSLGRSTAVAVKAGGGGRRRSKTRKTRR
jgi:hypothetical protein